MALLTNKTLSEIDDLIRIFEQKARHISPVISYSVGDVIKVSINKSTKQTAFAYIRAVNITHPLLNFDSNSPFYGIEYFNYKPNWKLPEIDDLQILNVINKGYGDLIKKDEIIGAPIWTQYKSEKAIKENACYNHKVFVNAAKYGDIKVIQHMMSMKDYPNNPTIYNYICFDKSNKKQTINTKISAFYASVFYNHFDIVQLFISKTKKSIKSSFDNINVVEHEQHPKLPIFRRIRNCDVLKSEEDRYKNVQFYNIDLFAKLCKDSNIKILQLLLEHDSWPIYCAGCYALYNVCSCGNIKVLKLLLSYININNPYFINIALPFNKDNRLLIPQTNLNLLNCAVAHKHLNIIKYVLTEWKYRDYIIKNEAIYHSDKPHTLPLLLYILMDTNLNDLDKFTLKCIKFLISTFDADEIGLNWVCNKKLNQQRHFIFGQIEHKKCFLFAILHTLSPDIYQDYVLWINRGMMIGSLFAALMYKGEILWRNWNQYYSDDNNMKQRIKELIWMFIENGMDWNIYKYNKLVLYTYHKNIMWNLIDLNNDICSNKNYKLFIKETIYEYISKYRVSWINAFISFNNEHYKLDKTIINIFQSDILDFVVMREDVLERIKYFDTNCDNEENEDEHDVDNKLSLYMRLQDARKHITIFDKVISDEYRRLGNTCHLMRF